MSAFKFDLPQDHPYLVVYLVWVEVALVILRDCLFSGQDDRKRLWLGVEEDSEAQKDEAA